MSEQLAAVAVRVRVQSNGDLLDCEFISIYKPDGTQTYSVQFLLCAVLGEKWVVF